MTMGKIVRALRELGIETICPTTIGAKIIRDKLMNMPYEATPSFDFGTLSSLSVAVSDGLAGQRVGDVEVEGRIKIAALRRGGKAMIPESGLKLALGDELNAIVVPEALEEFLGHFASYGDHRTHHCFCIGACSTRRHKYQLATVR